MWSCGLFVDGFSILFLVAMWRLQCQACGIPPFWQQVTTNIQIWNLPFIEQNELVAHWWSLGLLPPRLEFEPCWSNHSKKLYFWCSEVPHGTLWLSHVLPPYWSTYPSSWPYVYHVSTSHYATSSYTCHVTMYLLPCVIARCFHVSWQVWLFSLWSKYSSYHNFLIHTLFDVFQVALKLYCQALRYGIISMKFWGLWIFGLFVSSWINPPH